MHQLGMKHTGDYKMEQVQYEKKSNITQIKNMDKLLFHIIQVMD